MGFINNANQIIGDNMRYVQQLQANPQLLTGSQTMAPSLGASASSDPMAMMMPMLMMMMFQLMGQNGSLSGQTGQQNPYQTSQDPFGSLPPAMPMPPFQTPPNALPPQDQGPAQWIQQNPAYQFLTAQLGQGASTATGSASTSNTGTTAIIPPSFDDNASIATTMNALLAGNPDQNLRAMGTHLLSGTMNGTDPATIKAQVQNELIQQGVSGHDIDAFGVLYDAMQNNNALDQAEIVNATTPSVTNANQVAQLAQNQQDYSQQWDSLYPDGDASTASASTTTAASVPTTTATTTATSQDLTPSVQNALASGQFTPTELGQSLKYLLDHAPSEDMGSLTGLISNLTKAGQLNILPFLHSKYLDKLPPVRQEALLGAVEDAGLTLDNGQPNSRLAGYLLENLSRPGTSSTQNFLAQFLQNEWLNYGQDTTSAEGKALANVMSLSGLQGTVGQPLTLTQ